MYSEKASAQAKPRVAECEMKRCATKKILVTGGCGMLGSRLVPYLRECGHQVETISRSGESSVRSDLTDTIQVTAALERVSPDVVVNLAALTNVDECERSPHRAYLANVRIVENLANWTKRSGRSHLIQISTDQVYDSVGLHTEEDVHLTNYYGFSKYAGELAAENVSGTILRTNFFGLSRCSGRSSLSDWLVRSLREGRAVTVFEDISFSPLSLRRLVEELERVARTPKPGIFNLGSSDGMSKADFAFELAGVLNLPVATMRRGRSTDANFVAYRPKNMCMDSTRYEKTYAVELPSLGEEIRSMRCDYGQ